jgi:hypothetical protein
MAAVSSLSSHPMSRLVPAASAEQTSARFVRLFEPGIRTVASGGEIVETANSCIARRT